MTTLTPDIPQVEIQIVEMTNRVRAEQKLAAVKPNAELGAAARAYAAFLAKSGTFSHTADGHEAGDRITAAGYKWCQVGENLALAQSSNGFKSAELATKAVEGWLNSPGHRQNLMQPHMTEIGVGVARAADKDPKYITVQLFGRPQSLMYEFQISNATEATVSYEFGGEKHEVKPSFAVTHTYCAPSTLAFEKAGPKKLGVSYDVAGGVVYILKSDKAGGVNVEIAPKRTVR